jgi:hypothetical protein
MALRGDRPFPIVRYELDDHPDGGHVAVVPQPPHLGHRVLGQRLSEHPVDTCLSGDRDRGARVVTRDHDGLQAHAIQSPDHVRGLS